MQSSALARTRITRTTALATIVGTLALSSLGHAFARVPEGGTSTDDHEAYCYFLQQEYDQAHADQVSAPIGSADYQDAASRVGAVIIEWVNAGCNYDYGSISARVVIST